jgi:uncharacterized protein (TIGR03435 family)
MKPAALVSLFVSAAAAQTTPAPPAFEVASVKVAAPQPPGQIMRGCGKPDPAMVRCTNATLKLLIQQAYNVKAFQIQGPAWLDTDGFDLMAKPPAGTPADQIPAMLQSLLAERFGVTLHKETKTLPAYELTVLKSGLKMKEVDPATLPAPLSFDPAAPPPPPPPPRAAPPMPAGAVMMMMAPNGSRMLRGNMTLPQLVNALGIAVDRPIFDKTDLKGTYKIELNYLADETDAMSGRMPMMMDGGAVGGVAGHGGPGPEPPHGPEAAAPIANIFQSVQQTLGLKLDPARAPVETLIIDKGNRVPTEN